MKHRQTLFSLPLFCAFALSLSAQSVTGTWISRVSNNDGTFRETIYRLEQNGEALTGAIVINYRPNTISEGSIQNGHFHFVMGSGNRRRTVDGTIKGEELSLDLAGIDGRPVEHVVATRTTADAGTPPPPLPVPALHDVPDNGLARTPPMGWNSWNHFSRKIDDTTVRRIADAMVSSGLKKAGYIYVNIDDTWQGSRDAAGNLHPNTKFPDMKALADYVHSKGLKLGIYSGPGPTTCAAYAGSFGHEEQDAQLYASWGIDYLKYDWCSAGAIYKDTDMRGVYQKMGDALQKTGRPIVFSLCQYGKQDVWKWGAKTGGNSWRTTGDIKDNWPSMEKIGFAQIEIAPYIRVGHWNDPDMLEIGNGGMTDDEYRTHMTLWSMLAAPLLAGNDIRNMSDATKAILMNTDVIAIDQDRAAHPPEKITTEGATEIWKRTLSDGSVAVALFNRGADQTPVTLTWSNLGLHGKLHAKNLWTHKNVTASGVSASFTVPSHGVTLLRVQGKG